MLKQLAILVISLLAFAGSASADVGLIVRSVAAVPGQPFTVYGPCGGMRVYLVRGVSPRRTTFSARAPGAPYRFLGRLRCTGRIHNVGDFPDGDWASWSAILRFRVPPVSPGVYRLIVFCEPCRRGPGGSLIDGTFLWRGNTRIGRGGLWILPRV